MKLSLKDFNTTKTGTEKPQDLCDAVVQYLQHEHDRFKTSRQQVEDVWLESWSFYLGTPQAVEEQRRRTLFTVGEVNNDWRHKINTGKAYEIVETMHGYLMSATFPNSEWFSMTPQAPGYARLSRVVTKYLSTKMEEANFKSHYSIFLRQLLITGTSVLALPWRYETRPYKRNVRVTVPDYDIFTGEVRETKSIETVEEERVVKNHPDYETVDVFDCWVDPAVTDPNEGGFFRRVEKTRAELINMAESGYYNVSPLDIINAPASNSLESEEKDNLRWFQGVETETPYSMADMLEVLEYWGDVHLDGVTLHDVHACLLGKQLIKCEPNPFWSGKPFVIGTCTRTPQSPYSMGVLQPNLGLLQQLNIITNQRLDNLELNTDTVLLVRQDGVLNPDDVFIAPGKTIYVSDPNAVVPLQLPNAHTVTYQEGAVLEQTIDKNAGTGAMISANAGRSGERVTAAEIAATRDAGGNRLSNLQSHVETTSLIPVLRKTYRNAQQFVTDDELVRVSGKNIGEFEYFRVGVAQLSHDFNIRPIGSQHVIDRTKYVQDRLQFLSAVAQVPQMAQRINYDAVLYDIIQHFGFDDPDSYLVQPEQQQMTPEGMPAPTSQVPVAPGSTVTQDVAQQMITGAGEAGGQPMQDAVEANFKADGGRELLSSLVGTETNPLQASLEA